METETFATRTNPNGTYRTAGYRWVLHFNRHHTSGTFAGQITTASLPFCTYEDAAKYVTGCNKHAKRNGYTVTAREIVEL